MPKRTSSHTKSSHSTFSRRVAPFAPLALALAMKTAQPTPPTPPPVPTGVAAQASFAQQCSNPHFPTDVSTAMDDEACGIAGSGGKETWQNEAKNNYCAPDPAEPTTFANLISLQQEAQKQNLNFGNPRQHPLTSNAGPVTDRAPLAALGEGKQVVLQGFVKLARQEGAESVNCGKNVPDNPVDHDIHVSIVPNATDAECAGVVVEMTPHHRPAAWTAALVNQVAHKGLLVQVTGQQMFDSSHSPCINGTAVQGDPSRVSLWEIHPIYKFEVCPSGNCSTGGWIPLESWTP